MDEREELRFKKELQDKLAKEYERYLVVDKLINFNKSTKYRVTLERSLIAMAADLSVKRKDPVFLDVDVDHNHYRDYFYYPNTRIENKEILLDKIRKEIKIFLKKDKFEKIQSSEYGNEDNLFYCKNYKHKLNLEIYLALKNRIDYKYKKFSTLIILIMLLRYESISSKYQQWGIPSEFYKVLYQNHNIRFEGFTSPLNSGLIIYGDDTYFCSLFYDTDLYFGSIGNFFDTNFYILNKKKGEIRGILVPNSSLGIFNTLIDTLEEISNYNIHMFLITMEFVSNLPTDDYSEIKEKYDNLKNNDKVVFYKNIKSEEFFLENRILNSNVINFFFHTNLDFYVFDSKKKSQKGIDKILGTLSRKKINIKDQEGKIRREYTRYKYTEKMLNLVKNNSKYFYEWRNILERLLQTISNIPKKKYQDPVLVSVGMESEAIQKFISECKEKNIPNYMEKADETIKIIKEFDRLNKNNSFFKIKDFRVLTRSGSYTEFLCDDFSFKLSSDIYLSLLKRLDNFYDIKYNPEIYILIVLLRYSSILVGGQNWNIPFSVYNYLFTNYNCYFEGFSSPLNSQLVLIDRKTNYPVNFGCLFLDTDNYFGCIGNVFDLNFSERKRKKDKFSLFLNPPYIECVIQKMVDKIYEILEQTDNIRIFCVIPYWDNFKPIDELRENKYLKLFKVLNHKEYYYENSADIKAGKIYPRSKLSFYVLSNFARGRNEPKYETILESFKE